MKWISLVFLAAISFSCETERVSMPAALPSSDQKDAVSDVALATPDGIAREVVETYADRSKIGRRGHNRIEIDIVKRGEFRGYHPDNLAVIRFYSMDRTHKWKLSQTLEIPDGALALAVPNFEDFNADGLNDVTFISGTAARGANEIRTLLIYDKRKDQLVHIRNSEEFPNLQYNRKLKCIDAWRIYGGTATDFVRIEGDHLKAFASVENFEGYRTVTLIDNHGAEKINRRDKISDNDLFVRYTNFHPIEY